MQAKTGEGGAAAVGDPLAQSATPQFDQAVDDADLDTIAMGLRTSVEPISGP